MYACSCDFKTVVHIPTDSVDRLTMADETAALLLFLGQDKAAHNELGVCSIMDMLIILHVDI